MNGPKDERCINLRGDRIKGADAEERFVTIMRNSGFTAIRLQPKTKEGAATKLIKGERIVVGDVDVMAPDGKEFNAETKSKYPTKYGAYGIEEYRVNHYLRYEELTGIPVVYVIEKTKESKEDKILPIEQRKWLWRDFKSLLKKPFKKYYGWTWIGGQKKIAMICYFNEEWFNDMGKKYWNEK